MTYQLLKMPCRGRGRVAVRLAVRLFLLTSQPQEGEAPRERKMLGALRRWTLFVTTPAMALSWLVGLHLAMSFGWFAMNWIWVKIGIAAVLSALHPERGAGPHGAPPADGRRRWICMRRSRCRPRPSSRWRWSSRSEQRGPAASARGASGLLPQSAWAGICARAIWKHPCNKDSTKYSFARDKRVPRIVSLS